MYLKDICITYFTYLHLKLKNFFNYFYFYLFISKKQNQITVDDIIEFQQKWANSIIKMGSYKNNKYKLNKYCNKFIDKCYNKSPTILFKPTKAKINPFRRTKKEIASYFITGEIKKDKGFVFNQWQTIQWRNTNIIIKENYAVCMGNYKFISKSSIITDILAEYSFVFEKNKNNELKLILHHSSVPYK